MFSVYVCVNVFICGERRFTQFSKSDDNIFVVYCTFDERMRYTHTCALQSSMQLIHTVFSFSVVEAASLLKLVVYASM